ncbi:hypothetical protein CcaCcLH18_09867 [Colletotrichum camelliae]|nr:hypothetical protein CcaCcLH18_09867 [Colletotrichum camelliae]
MQTSIDSFVPVATQATDFVLCAPLFFQPFHYRGRQSDTTNYCDWEGLGKLSNADDGPEIDVSGVWSQHLIILPTRRLPTSLPNITATLRINFKLLGPPLRHIEYLIDFTWVPLYNE